MTELDALRRSLTAPGMPFEMVERDLGGRRVRTWRHAPESLRALVLDSREFGDRDFIRYQEERLSYAEHFAAVATFAHRLAERGVAPGDRVALAMRNYPEWSVAFFAAASLGAVAVPLNAWWTAGELEFALRDSGSSVLVADGRRAELLGAIPADLGIDLVVVRPEGPLPAGAADWDAVLGAIPADAALPDAEVGPDDLATLFYTSGTTGRPKGAVGTHRNICTNPVSVAYGAALGALRGGTPLAEALAAQPERTSLLPVPLFHATGCHSVLVSTFRSGGALVLMHKWDPAEALRLVERHRVTHFTGVPTQLWQMCAHPDLATRDLSSLRTAGSGGAPAPPHLLTRMVASMPDRGFSNGYGLTETSSATSINAAGNYLAKPDSVGPPVAVVDVKVVDAVGEEVPTGGIGELWIKGPNVVVGYWNRPDATAEAITPDGWLRSGDLAHLDDEGFIHVVDRAKDMVIRGGENVYSAEVEAAVFEHPGVRDCAVVGVPHEELGEEVGAVVQPEPGVELDPEALRRFLGERIAAFKVPAHVWLRTEDFPRNAAGKLLKRALRDEVVPG
ncbi:class I adenylate-forming enzyme family protein [Saccharopolyspora cebuensis]|uniref:class I adenylate-forming enzyme family protein n=1 Tax=Saccharopolyspora cebuensis TaxID=418759 RepID=UPI0031EE6E0D